MYESRDWLLFQFDMGFHSDVYPMRVQAWRDGLGSAFAQGFMQDRRDPNGKRFPFVIAFSDMRSESYRRYIQLQMFQVMEYVRMQRPANIVTADFRLITPPRRSLLRRW